MTPADLTSCRPPGSRLSTPDTSDFYRICCQPSSSPCMQYRNTSLNYTTMTRFTGSFLRFTLRSKDITFSIQID